MESEDIVLPELEPPVAAHKVPLDVVNEYPEEESNLTSLKTVSTQSLHAVFPEVKRRRMHSEENLQVENSSSSEMLQTINIDPSPSDLIATEVPINTVCSSNIDLTGHVSPEVSDTEKNDSDEGENDKNDFVQVNFEAILESYDAGNTIFQILNESREGHRILVAYKLYANRQSVNWEFYSRNINHLVIDYEIKNGRR